MAAEGKLLDRKPRPGTAPNEGSAFRRRNLPGLLRPEATSAGSLQLSPPLVDFEYLIESGPVLGIGLRQYVVDSEPMGLLEWRELHMD